MQKVFNRERNKAMCRGKMVEEVAAVVLEPGKMEEGKEEEEGGRERGG